MVGGGSTVASLAGAMSVPTSPERDRYRRDGAAWLHGISDVGRVRRQNQDAFGFSADGSVLVVADGMGGHDFGDVASALAVEAVLEFLGDAGCRDGMTAEVGAGSALLQAVHFAHERIRSEVESDLLRRDMGTTVLVARIVGNTVHTCHVGDSRAYVSTEAGLHQLTRDHSVVEMLLRTGQITAAQTRFHPRKHQLTQALGVSKLVGPTLNETTLAPGDRLLLCSDGLWGAMADAVLAERTRAAGAIAEVAEQLVAEANLCGGNDNITAILYEHRADSAMEG